MNTVSLIFSTVALVISCFGILFSAGFIGRQPKIEDKYAKYRNVDGLLGKKKN